MFATTHENPKRRLIQCLGKALAAENGFFMTREEARIQRVRGFPTVAQRNHNPGLLRKWSTHPVEGGFVVFPSLAIGTAALIEHLTSCVYHKKVTAFTLLWGQGQDPEHIGYAGLYCNLSAGECSIKADSILKAALGEYKPGSNSDIHTLLCLLTD